VNFIDEFELVLKKTVSGKCLNNVVLSDHVDDVCLQLFVLWDVVLAEEMATFLHLKKRFDRGVHCVFHWLEVELEGLDFFPVGHLQRLELLLYVVRLFELGLLGMWELGQDATDFSHVFDELRLEGLEAEVW